MDRFLFVVLWRISALFLIVSPILSLIGIRFPDGEYEAAAVVVAAGVGAKGVKKLHSKQKKE